MPAKDSVFEKVGKTFATEKISRRVQGMAVSAIKEMSLLAMETPNTVNLAWDCLPLKPPSTFESVSPRSCSPIRRLASMPLLRGCPG